MTNDHKLRGFRQHTFILSWFWMSEVPQTSFNWVKSNVSARPHSLQRLPGLSWGCLFQFSALPPVCSAAQGPFLHYQSRQGGIWVRGHICLCCSQPSLCTSLMRTLVVTLGGGGNPDLSGNVGKIQVQTKKNILNLPGAKRGRSPPPTLSLGAFSLENF